MTIVVTCIFGFIICFGIEFAVPVQVATFYWALGGPSTKESRSNIATPKYKKVKLIRFFLVLPLMLFLTYYTILSYTPAVIAMMAFILVYSSYVGFSEIQLVRKNHVG
jgi:hypothetical protein